MASVVAYFIAWWLTSLEPPSRRHKVQRGLQPHYEALSRLQQRLQDADSPEEVEELMPDLQSALTAAGSWIKDHMTQAALEKFKAPSFSASCWPWPGKAQGAARSRSNALSLNRARLDVLDTLLKYDGWDGPTPPLHKRIAKMLGR